MPSLQVEEGMALRGSAGVQGRGASGHWYQGIVTYEHFLWDLRHFMYEEEVLLFFSHPVLFPLLLPASPDLTSSSPPTPSYTHTS